MLRQLSTMLLLACLLSIVGTGCCCVQGMPGETCGSGGGLSSCGGGCPPGPLLGLASCRGACGETYVDEWVSEPPVVDDCGFGCTGCDRCRQPVRNILRLLWGRPYMSQCSTGLCGPSCGGCDSCGGTDELVSNGYAMDSFDHSSGLMATAPAKSCNCGSSAGHAPHNMSAPDSSINEMSPQALPPASLPRNGTPSPAPTLSPEALPSPDSSVTPSSAVRRLNPAMARRR